MSIEKVRAYFEHFGIADRIREFDVSSATVELADEDSGEEVSYQIVGDLEADIKQRLISVSSPFARALIGKSEGDSFEFVAPNGTRNYEILAVRYDT